jgi:hypothetical protein
MSVNSRIFGFKQLLKRQSRSKITLEKFLECNIEEDDDDNLMNHPITLEIMSLLKSLLLLHLYPIQLINIVIECVGPHIYVQGDLFDNIGERGTGLFYFNGKTKLYSSSGEYGYFLPSISFKIVQKYGLEFFDEDCGAEYVLIPKNYNVSGTTDRGNIVEKQVDNNYQLALAVAPRQREQEIQKVTVNGKIYDTDLVEFY